MRINDELLDACERLRHVCEGEDHDEAFDGVRDIIARAKAAREAQPRIDGHDQIERLMDVAELAREYATICEDREQRERRKSIVSEVARLTALEAVSFAQQVASWTTPTGAAICMRLTVLANRIKETSPWIHVGERLPATRNYMDMDVPSVNVLVTDGKQQWIGYLIDTEPGEPLRWKERGRDGYDLDGITHWQPLGNLPD